MKLKFTLLALLMACVSSLSAQQYADDYVIKKNAASQGQGAEMIYGVMVGALVPVMSDKSDIIDINNSAGYELGMMWGVDLGGLEIVPEIWYQHNTSDFRNSATNLKGKMNMHSVEMPILIGMELGPVRFNFGPSFALSSSGKIEVAGREAVDLGRTKSTVGYLFGVSSVLFDHLILDVRYTGRFATAHTAWDEGSWVSEEVLYRYYSFGFNVGYKF